MKKFISALLILAGIALVAISINQLFQQKEKTARSLDEARLIVADREEKDENKPFSPNENEVIGILHIPKLGKSLPIIEGTDEEMLEKGVGHHLATKYPGDNEQILLSGHRDTVFMKFGELEEGDRFIVEMPYGRYEYVMKEAEIVDADNTTVIGPKGEEVLTLSTCYPFNYIGSAPERYIIYAYPENE